MAGYAQVEEVVNETTGKIYQAPCQMACPLKMDTQRSHAMIALLPSDIREAKEQMRKIGDEVYEKNPLFPICAYICGKFCETECNYKDEAGAVRRRMLLRFLSEHYLPHLGGKPPFAPPSSKGKVAIVGGGPGGLMCAYALSEKGYQVTIFEQKSELGGALRYIPRYRLPKEVIDTTSNNLLRIANVKVEFGVKIGGEGKTLDNLKSEGYQAIFIATGTILPRPLTIGRDLVPGADLGGVEYGLNLLSDVSQDKVSPQLYQGKKVVVVGGGNVAFDVARTARRLGGDVSVVCLECEDKSSKDGIPADVEEIEGGSEEGIRMVYSRGVQEIMGKSGKFEKLKCPLCTQVWAENGMFSPEFNFDDVIYLEGDVLLITIGQMWERAIFQQEGLLNDKGRLDVDQSTLMSNLKEGVFIGGDLKRIGFAVEALRDGMVAAESIERYLSGADLRAGREKEYESAPIPKLLDYKTQPQLKWVPAEERLNFELFEKGFTLEEARGEAMRCLYCGPCKSCKGCVALELQPEIPEIEVNKDLCSGCGICVAVCPYDAAKLEKSEEGLVSVTDDLKCKRCGACVAACPAEARAIKDKFLETVATALGTL